MEKLSRTLIGLLCAVAGITSFESAGAAPAAATTPACDRQPMASIELKVDAFGRPLVPVTISGTSVFMILEVAQHYSVLSRQAVDRFKLRTEAIAKGMLFTSGGKTVEDFAYVNELLLAKIPYPDKSFLVDPSSDASSNRYGSPDIVGILGNDVLWKMDMELDLQNRALKLYKPGECRDNPVSWANSYESVPLQRNPLGEFYFPIELNGRKLEATFRSAGSRTMLSTDVTKRVYGFDKNSPGIEIEKDANGQTIASYKLMAMTSAGISIAEEPVQLIDPPFSQCQLVRKADAIGYTGCLYSYPLLLGNDILNRLHIYIDTAENRMYYTGKPSDARR